MSDARCGYPRPTAPTRFYGCRAAFASWALNRAMLMQRSMDDDTLNEIDKHEVPWTPRMLLTVLIHHAGPCVAPIEARCE